MIAVTEEGKSGKEIYTSLGKPEEVITGRTSEIHRYVLGEVCMEGQCWQGNLLYQSREAWS